MKRWIPALFIAFLGTVSAGASSWEGSAMMAAYGEFPDSGYYAACNSFPRNTVVEVANLENGKTVTVIVTKGLENPGIFLLLSPEAAKVLSMDPGMVFRVRVSAPRNIVDSPALSGGSGGDPDFNPSLLASRSSGYKPSAANTAEPQSETPAAPVPESPSPTAAGEPDAKLSIAPEPSAKENLNAKEEPVPGPEVLARSNDAPKPAEPVTAPILAPEPTSPAAMTEDTALVFGLERPDSLEQTVQADLADPSLMPNGLPETPLATESRPETKEPEAALSDPEIKSDDSGKTEALALGGVEKAPVQPLSVPAALPPASEPAPLKETPPPVFAATSAVPGKYYIQVGAYKTSSSLNSATARLSAYFPVAVDTVTTGPAPLYRLLVGPLGRDETGVALLKVQSLGFKGAFLKN